MGMTTEENEQRKARFWQLVQRHNQLGRLLPALEEIQAGERHDDAGLILDEMHKVPASDRCIDRHKDRAACEGDHDLMNWRDFAPCDRVADREGRRDRGLEKDDAWRTK